MAMEAMSRPKQPFGLVATALLHCCFLLLQCATVKNYVPLGEPTA